VYQRVDLADRLTVEPAPETTVRGFADDTIVQRALGALGDSYGWRVTIEKRFPVTAGLGGGSSDAATALRLANSQLAKPLTQKKLHAIAAATGADVPFFLGDGPQLGSGDGTVLDPLDLPQDFAVLLFLPAAATKSSTADVYAAFDARGAAEGFEARAAQLREALAAARRPRDLAALPANDLASSPFAERLLELGAFRADVSGAGPTVYGLFHDRAAARAARRALRRLGRGIVTVPAWYG
jgi:4-diphosphocytidyl-2-C-methyl-D-erythritol kinase